MTTAHLEQNERDDRRADHLLGQTFAGWTVIDKRERQETPSGRRAVYVVQHRDGRVKGLRGWQLNAVMAQAATDGLA